MKALWLLAATFICAPIVRGQEPPVSTQTNLAQVDPAARDLLARTTAHYQNFRTFESLISWRDESPEPMQPRRFRVQLTRDGEFVVGEEFPDKSWRKWICDGKTIVGFHSRFPKRYTRETFKFPFYPTEAQTLEASLRSVGAEGPLITLLTDGFGSALLSPDLHSLSLQSKGNLQEVTFRFPNSPDTPAPRVDGKVDSQLLQIGIDPQTLLLDYIIDSVVLKGRTLTLIESYSQTRINPEFAPNLFRAAAPKGYKLIDSFETDVATTTPPQMFVE